MKVGVFSTRGFERASLAEAAERHGQGVTFLEAGLSGETAALAEGFDCVCPFVNDTLDAGVLGVLAGAGVRLISLRSAGFNNVDVEAAEGLGLTVARVPAYSPYAVAEHTVGLMLTLNRKLHKAYNRVREGNFALDGLIGFDFNGRTVGVVGTGRIGAVVCRIMLGFGCRVLGFDPQENEECARAGVEYVELDELLRRSDVVTLHCPLTPGTHHMIDAGAIGKMKRGVMLINTSRGALVDTRAVIEALKGGRIGQLGLDVYEEEADLFFRDLSDQVLHDDVFARLLTFPNVVITGHQAFFTREALENIAETAMGNAAAFERGGVAGENLVTGALVRG